ncbi:MAG: hypothetical protein IH623_27830 [Verrucomicrobia bacterium]|nr:hypothetical protein [Verrucomicrobiota bacterium]
MSRQQVKYPALCEPDLEEEACELNAAQRREMARTFERWVQQLDFSADFLDHYDKEVESDAPKLEAAMIERAARLEREAADIRWEFSLPQKTKRCFNLVAFTGN